MGPALHRAHAAALAHCAQGYGPLWLAHTTLDHANSGSTPFFLPTPQQSTPQRRTQRHAPDLDAHIEIALGPFGVPMIQRELAQIGIRIQIAEIYRKPVQLDREMRKLGREPGPRRLETPYMPIVCLKRRVCDEEPVDWRLELDNRVFTSRGF